MKKFYILVILLFICVNHIYAKEKSVLLQLGPAENFLGTFGKLKNGIAPGFNKNKYIIIGAINSSDFAVTNAEQVRLYDGTGKAVPLEIEKSSLYSEFGDEINSMVIRFRLNEDQIAAGNPRLVWGAEIKEKNKLLKQFIIYKGNLSVYRSFTIQEGAVQSNESNFATIDVIVDDYADKYYLWYLFPVFILLLFLIYRKFRIN